MEKKQKIINSRFVPRPYQCDLYRAFFIDGYRRIMRIMHRRAGKDHEAWSLIVLAALQKPGLYLYLLPTIGQANAVIWQGRGKTGVSFLDYVPKQLIHKTNDSTMRVVLHNGSIICVTGSNNYRVLIGTNPMGIVYSEFQDADPASLDYMRPVLAENGGWLLINGTTRGRHNNLFKVYDANKGNDNWFVSVKTVDDTRDWDGNPIITKEAIDDEVRAGMPPELIDQEFYCSWDGFTEGAYFTAEMKKMREDGRISKFEVLKDVRVHTAFDIGMGDATSVGLYQIHPDNSIRCIYYFEDRYKSAEFYAKKLMTLKRDLGFKEYGKHFLPHDVMVSEWGSGRTRIEQLHSHGIKATKVPKVSISERIQCGRTLLARLWLNEGTTSQLEMALCEYHALKNSSGEPTKPAHNWASHGVDQFTYLAVGYMDSFDKPLFQKQKYYAKITP